jgi:hypothetical protein
MKLLMNRFALPRRALAVLAIVAAYPLTAVYAAPPQRVSVEYDMSQNGNVMVSLKETLEHDGKTYRISSEGKGKGVYALANRGSVSRSSQGAVTPSGLRPAEFRDQRGSELTTARFDWQAKSVMQEHRGKKESQPLASNAHDRLSFLWNFGFQPPKGKIIEAVVVDGRGAPAHYRYEIAGSETLKTAAGDIETVRLVKKKEAGDDRGTELWLAVKRDYAPVRILVTEKDGTRIDQIATRIE